MLIDSHCHLDFPIFDEDRDAVLSRAAEAGVEAIIVPAVSKNYWQTLSSLRSSTTVHLHKAYGLHPCFLSRHQPSDIDHLNDILSKHQSIAIGECGLDYYDKNADKKTQQHYFNEQLSIAKDRNLPLIVHARKATEEVLLMCKKHQVRAILHSFSGSLQQAKKAVDSGYYLGFGGPLTWDNSTRLHKMLEYLPLDAIIIESDAPDQPDQDHKGQRNEPAWLPAVVKKIAKLHSKDYSEVAQLTSQNTKKAFSL